MNKFKHLSVYYVLASIITATLVVLKLLEVIAMPWFLVTLPMYLPLLIFFLAFVSFLVLLISCSVLYFLVNR